MIRKYFARAKESTKEKIRWRSHEPSRIEAFSDAVFAFTISLLAFSLEVPKNSEELLKGMGAWIPFLFCFFIVISTWYSQYKFFRHYGLHDNVTMLLNIVLLVVILFYVYPLKFMVTIWLSESENVLRPQDVLPVAVIYNGGFTAIYALFTLMHCNAYSLREELQLTPAEVFETRTHIYNNLTLTILGLTTILAAIIGNLISVQNTFACFILYAFIGPVMAMLGAYRGKLYHKKFGKAAVQEPELGSE